MTQTTLNNAVVSMPLTAAARAQARRPRRLNAAVVLSAAVLVVMTAAVLLADVLTPHRPETINLRARLTPPLTLTEHPLGTDATGRDVLTRILHGGRVSLLVGVVSTLIGLALGTLLGIISGYFRGWLDELIMYLVDVQLALPFVLLAVAVALVLGRSLPVLIGLAALSTWSLYARVIRGEVLSLREREFIVAARSLGAQDAYIMLRHMLPNLAGPLLVLGDAERWAHHPAGERLELLGDRHPAANALLGRDDQRRPRLFIVGVVAGHAARRRADAAGAGRRHTWGLAARLAGCGRRLIHTQSCSNHKD
jgi:peptide/nickel transport system permease protein